jgi:sensor histidine kinase YesM
VLADELAIEIEDDGPGSNGRTDVLTSGIGLSSSAERLRLLYGERALLDARDRDNGGFRVHLRLPLRSSS